MISHSSFQRILFAGSLGSFVLAGYTGFAYRWGLTGGLPEILNLVNIRHAHSHLMFFCWAVPLPLMVFTSHLAPHLAGTKTAKKLHWAIITILVTGFITFPFFLLFGYHPVSVLGANIPFSVIFSGIAMLGWYLFSWLYMRVRKKISITPAAVFFEPGLVMLLISSLGAWGVAVAQYMGISNPAVPKLLTHFFLATFTEGWCLLAALGLLWLRTDLTYYPSKKAVVLLMMASPLLFTIGLYTSEIQLITQITTKAALAIQAYALWRILWPAYSACRKNIPVTTTIIFYAFFALTFIKLAAVILPTELWIDNHGFRIFYLHLFLLGVFSLILLETVAGCFQVRPAILKAVSIAILAVIISLVLNTNLWPLQWSAYNPQLLAGAALLPALAACLMLPAIFRNKGC